MTMDSATLERLHELRRFDRSGFYASDEPASGDDPTGAVTVTVDPTDRVARVEVRSRDTIRRPEGLARAVDQAYRAAQLARIDALPGRHGSRGDLHVAGTGERPPVVAVRDVSGTGYVSTRRPSPETGRPEDFGPTSGVSDNDCVRVTLDVASSRGAVDAGADWLANATATNIGNAVTEAYADAYRKRDQA